MLNSSYLTNQYRLSFVAIALFFIGIFASISTHMFGGSYLLIIVLITISSVPGLLMIFDGKLHRNITIILIYLSALMLLYHNALGTNFLFGRDIAFEIFHAREILEHNSLVFQRGINEKMNGLFSVTLYSAIISKVTGVSLTQTYKIAYPIIFALTPLLVYRIGEILKDNLAGYCASFLYLSYFFFFTAGLEGMKQSISMFFVSLFVLGYIYSGKKKIYTLILSVVGLSISHYGIPYIILVAAVGTFALLILAIKLTRYSSWASISIQNNNINGIYTTICLGLFMVLIHWYVSSGHGFTTVVVLGGRIINSISGLFGTVSKSGSHYTSGQATPSFTYDIMQYLYLFSQLLISIGYLKVSHSILKDKSEFNRFVHTFSGFMLVFLASSFIVPTVLGGFSLGLTRMYQISLIPLSVYFPIGVFYLAKKLSTDMQTTKKVLTVFFLLFILLNSKVVMELHIRMTDPGSDYSASVSLSQERIKKGNAHNNEIVGYYRSVNSQTDVYSAWWLREYVKAKKTINMDRSLLLTMYGHKNPRSVVTSHDAYPQTNVSQGEYLLLREVNIRHKLFINKIGYTTLTDELSNYDRKNNVIYSTGQSKVYV